MTRNKSFNGNYLLYLVATPIGNLKEFTPRAIEVLSDADLIAAEDTRNSQKLLSCFNISKPMISLREHNERASSSYIIEQIKAGKKVCYVSDAGYPLISDPGQILVEECIKNDINVSTICGSSAFLNALTSSGIDTKHFYFHGFLPSKSSEAKKELESIKEKKETLIFYESPHRIFETLKLMNDILGDRSISLGRELTKLNEEFIRGNLSELIDLDPSSIKGEIVLIVEGNNDTHTIDIEKIKNDILFLKSKNLSNKDIVDILVKFNNVRKNEIFDLVQETKI